MSRKWKQASTPSWDEDEGTEGMSWSSGQDDNGQDASWPYGDDDSTDAYGATDRDGPTEGAFWSSDHGYDRGGRGGGYYGHGAGPSKKRGIAAAAIGAAAGILAIVAILIVVLSPKQSPAKVYPTACPGVISPSATVAPVAPRPTTSAPAVPAPTPGQYNAWSFDTDSWPCIMTIYGAGPMQNDAPDGATGLCGFDYPWYGDYLDAQSKALKKHSGKLEAWSIVIGDGITTVGDGAFQDWYHMRSIHIPLSVVQIYENAFWENGLIDIFYAGSQSDWSKIDIVRCGDSANCSLMTATIHYGTYLDARPCAEDIGRTGCTIEYPKDDEYYDHYEYAIVDAPKGHSILGFATADHSGNGSTVLDGERVTILAERNGWACVIIRSTNKARWVNMEHLIK